MGFDFSDPQTTTLWELHCERKQRSIQKRSRVTVLVAASSLTEAMRKGEAFYGDEWTVWTATHVGQRVVLL
jgi:hypothetical protein